MFALVFAVWGGGAIWAVYGVIRLVIFIARKLGGPKEPPSVP